MDTTVIRTEATRCEKRIKAAIEEFIAYSGVEPQRVVVGVSYTEVFISLQVVGGAGHSVGRQWCADISVRV